MNGEKRFVKFSSSSVMYDSSGMWKLYIKLSLVIRWKYSSSLFCCSRPIDAIPSLHWRRSAILRSYAFLISVMNRLRNSLFSLSASSSAIAFAQLPLLMRAILCAVSWSSPRRSCSAASIVGVSMRGMSMRCVRLLIVSSSFSGSSEAMMKTVCCGGSSRTFRSLFALVPFMRSGSHIIDTL